MSERRLAQRGTWREKLVTPLPLIISAVLFATSGCEKRNPAVKPQPLSVDASIAGAAAEAPVELPPEVMAAFAPLPPRFEPDGGQLTEAQIEAGRALYSDARWSASGKVSCASCHDLAHFGIDRSPLAQGALGKLAPLNTPTVLNAAGASRFGSLGQHTALEPFLESHIQQTLAPPTSAWPKIASLLNTVAPPAAGVAPLRQASRALGAYVRTLVTPTRFDAFLSGDRKALSNLEKSGLLVFFQYCAECHRGALLGGDRTAKLGVKHPYIDPNPDAGLDLASVTGREEDRSVFRVPPLRNVSETGPYLRHGTVGTLQSAVEMMGWLQRSAMFSDKDAAALIAFLRTLSGTAPSSPSKP